MWTVVKWIVKLVLGLILLFVHWSLFLLFVVLLMLRNWQKQRRQSHARLSEEQEEGIVYREFELFDLEGRNEDGTDRKAIYDKCYRGDEVTLKYNPAPGNENRLEVWTKFGQIGLIAPYYVEQYADTFKSEAGARGRIKKIASGADASCILEIAFPTEEENAADR
ncbi:hypothetical protein FE782_00035 [Paenibacillus antri]|uniref:HIRAN domain-containing protein n=1 Tax=Paenibacillus antri TaxID=2582848 RepID=A0A5R9GK22_9BACL|nr:hypothetical protein [Paenibacillus antri]TLS53788.1 hypothetical protein FE782_00035 [Paenibacillus antri]